MNSRKWIVPALGMLISGTAIGGGLNIQPGLWEIQTKITVTGMPFPMPPRAGSLKRCIGKAEVEHPWKNLQKNKDCKFTDFKVSGHVTSYKMRCGGQTAAQGQGVMVIDSAAAFHGHTDMTMQSDGNTMKVHTESVGHRVGACKDSGR
jgi:hypothetical protein